MLWDVEGNAYIDYVCSWGPMILGHAHPAVIQAISDRAKQGTSYGAPTELEVDMAQTIVEMVPSIEMVIAAAVGGRHSLLGAIYGALLVNFGKTYFSEQFPELWLFLLGAWARLTMMANRPSGSTV